MTHMITMHLNIRICFLIYLICFQTSLERLHLAYEKILQAVRDTFNNLTAKNPEYQSCSNSLAAFIVERGKHVDWFSSKEDDYVVIVLKLC